MDEDEFRKTYDDLREYPCAFEKAILNRQCNCMLIRRFSLGEREGASCTDWKAHKQCRQLLDVMRDNARFITRSSAESGVVLPHARELRVQVGGLTGLEKSMHPDRETIPVDDIHATLQQAVDTYGSTDGFPWQNIIQSISAFKGRKRRSRNRD